MNQTAIDALIAEIEADVRVAERHLGKSALDPRVMAALRKVPRAEFVPPARRAEAYVNAPLPIGFGQTISQPFIVAVMTDALELTPGDRVLEIGTGCGYQTAILAELVAEVFSVEILAELATAAQARLRDMGYANVRVRNGDGREGWPEEAPFDAVIVTAAAREIPEPLLAQLKPGGRMVIPVGNTMIGQSLTRVTKNEDGKIEKQALLPVAFVPLVRGGKSRGR